ncbi:MAG: ABC transporter permease, partial [Cetobacterium sp.]
ESFHFVEYATFPEARIVLGDTVFRSYSEKGLNALNLPSLREDEVILDVEQFQKKDLGSIIALDTFLGKRDFVIRSYYKEESPFQTMKMGKRVITNNSTFNRLFQRSNYKNLVISFPKNSDGVDYTAVVVRELNRSRSNYELITVLETPDVYKKVERIKNLLKKGFVILLFISLFVVGFGVFNLIAFSIKSRGSYIGILRAQGISSKDLMLIFLLEATIIITSGVLIGLILGTLFSNLIGSALKISPIFNLWNILLAVLFTFIIGIGIGILPANKIGKLEIVEALKI